MSTWNQEEMIENLRSLECTERSYIRFVNKTNRKVKITWVDYNGKGVTFHYLKPLQYADVNTYKTHPWIALDIFNEQYLVGSSKVFMPKTTREIFAERLPDRPFPEGYEARRKIFVTLPMLSLKSHALMAVARHIVDPEEIDSLELPHQLKEKLKKALEQNT